MKQKDGRYRSKVVVGYKTDGSPVVKWISGRTKKELEEARAAAKGMLSKKTLTFEQYATQWYKAYKEPFLSPAGKQSYESVFNTHLFPAFGYRPLTAITAAELQSFMSAKQECAASLLSKLKTYICAIFRSAYSEGLIERDPSAALTRPKGEVRHRRALTEAETKAVLKVAEESPDGLFLYLLYYTGMRKGEVCGLMWQDVDLKNRVIKVRRDIDFVTDEVGKLKTPSSVRDIPIVDELLPHLQKGIGFVITRNGEHLTASSVNALWSRLSRQIAKCDGVETRGNQSVLSPHYFRHNFASVLYSAGVDVLSAQKILGHANPQTTMQIYTHLQECEQDKNAEKIRSAFKRQ